MEKFIKEIKSSFQYREGDYEYTSTIDGKEYEYETTINGGNNMWELVYCDDVLVDVDDDLKTDLMRFFYNSYLNNERNAR